MFYSAALHIAVEKENVEIVKLLLANEKININLPLIFNSILNQIHTFFR